MDQAEKVYVLGVNADHNSSAALLENGKVIACVSEERFNRLKNYYGIPRKSIEYCLNYAKIKPSNLNLVVIVSETPPPLPEWGFNNSRKTFLYRFLKFIHNLLITEMEWRIPVLRRLNEVGYSVVSFLLKPAIKKERIKKLQEILPIGTNKFILVDHHLCHSFTTLYGAPFIKEGNKEILVLTADAEGDGLAATVSVFKNGAMNRIGLTSQNNSVGNFYSAITAYLGMKPGEHEFKVMGLAPYASTEAIEKVFKIMKNWILVDKENLRFKTVVNAHAFGKLCQERLQGQRFDWIAGAAQKLLEERMIEWVEAAIKKTGLRNIAVAGGVFMNVKLNKLIRENQNILNFFVFPSCGDESNAFGACFYGYKKLNPNNNPEPIKDLYLGPGFDDLYITKIVNKLKGFKVSKPKKIELAIATLLSKGEIVARFAGRSEWGARALGNRSLLADPSNLSVVEKINKMIKNRDFWMPFAPVIMKEASKKYLVKADEGNSYMMLAYDTLEATRDEMSAAIHQYDKTARAQVLMKDFNYQLWEVLADFRSLTGRGVLLNTSFNIHGEPIVGSPQDAIDVLKRSGMKHLALGPYLISKS